MAYERDHDGMATRLSRAAFGPARAAARTGRSALADEAERAIDAFLSGPLPEAAARSVVRHHVVERMLATALTARTDGADGGIDVAQLERAAETVLRSPAAERLAAEAVQSPAFRRVLHD